jgi:hypothetical protein
MSGKEVPVGEEERSLASTTVKEVAEGGKLLN